MEYTNLLRVRKDSWSTPLMIIVMSLIAYSSVKENGMTVILLIVLSLGIVFSAISIFLFFLRDNGEKSYYLAAFFSMLALETGFINLWLMTINRPLLEIPLLLFFMIAGCILGFHFLRRKAFVKDTKQEKIRFGLISSFSCIGILLARILVLFINQDALLYFVRFLWEIAIFASSVIAGMLLYRGKSVSTQRIK